MRQNAVRLASVALLLAAAGVARAGQLAAFSIIEPLGQRWTDEWLTEEVELDLAARRVKVESLRVKAGDAAVPAQFYQDDRLLADADTLTGKVTLRVLFQATVQPKQTLTITLVDDPDAQRPWNPVTAATAGTQTTISNGLYSVTVDTAAPLPLNAIRLADSTDTLATFAWPDGLQPTAVTDTWLERGPARSILKRTFAFANPAHRYEVTYDFRANDPWIGVVDTYTLGPGTAITANLHTIKAEKVFHPFAYNARTFTAGGDPEDSTLQPPQHPIATLGPIWRDIWFNGGPYAFVYSASADRGLGFAAVRGSAWDTPEGITPESQNLAVNGDKEKEGLVTVRIPTDGGTRHWAIIPAKADMRKQIGRMIRARVDIPLQTVRKEWILDWESKADVVSNSLWNPYMGGPFNQHFFNPTTYPRTVAGAIERLKGPVKSRDLAIIAYIYSNPDYWPGPSYKWRIGNPNFNTDMYKVYLQIGLLMPDHPHAARWVKKGTEELKTNLYRDSYAGGAWAESLSYSAFFFHTVELAHKISESSDQNPLKDWPRYKEVAHYLAAMHTPVDPRYGTRQKAPIGDTGPGNYIKYINEVGEMYKDIDADFARKLIAFPNGGENALDISSREFFGFGAMLRGNAYNNRHESFVTMKAGPARNHFQGDELSFYFAGLGTPLAIDYACHYSPRPWHAAIHNRPDMNGKRPVAVAARRAFAKSAVADVFVADERTTEINHVPMEPHLATRPGWEYPTTHLDKDKPWTMRRYAMLVKHDPKTSPISDYLVIRDEIDAPETPHWNLHVLGRSIKRDGTAVHFPGQLGVDLTAHFLTNDLAGMEQRQWGWKNATDVRDSGGTRRTLKGEDYEKKFFGAWIPEDFTPGTWGKDKIGGEMAVWLRVKGQAGQSQWLVVLMPNLKDKPAPTVRKLSDTSAEISLGSVKEIVHLGSDGTHQAAVERDGKLTVLLKPGEVKPWSELEFKPIPQGVDMGAR